MTRAAVRCAICSAGVVADITEDTCFDPTCGLYVMIIEGCEEFDEWYLEAFSGNASEETVKWFFNQVMVRAYADLAGDICQVSALAGDIEMDGKTAEQVAVVLREIGVPFDFFGENHIYPECGAYRTV